MSLQVLIGVGLVFWLILLAAGLLAVGWSFSSIHKRFWLCVALSIAATLGSWWALRHYHLAWSQSVNGQRQWLVDSSWFFTTTLVLGGLALACTLWQRRKSSTVAPAK